MTTIISSRDEFLEALTSIIRQGLTLISRPIYPYQDTASEKGRKKADLKRRKVDYQQWDDANIKFFNAFFSVDESNFRLQYEQIQGPSPRRTSAESINQAIRQKLQILQAINLIASSFQYLNNGISTQLPKSMGKFENKVFIVHGHNDGQKQSVARVLEKLKLEPIILQEQANQGQTIIEKFESNSNAVGFAIILLTADDLGRAKEDTEERARARQNVVFEMGYFMGKLGRKHVFVLLEEGVEKPSDLDGIVYTSLKSSWRISLVHELTACGYEVDANNLCK